MQAGKLRRRITIQQHAAASTLTGGSASWVPVLVTWAQAEQPQTRALLALLAGQVAPTLTVRYVLRYPPRITLRPGMRVLDGTLVLTVQQVLDPDERRRELHLLCQETPAAAAP